MKLSLYGRLAMALFASLALGLGMTACGGGTIGYLWVLGQEAAGQTSGQIVGFKIDDFTGNLTQTARFSETTEGANPVSLVVKSGGRYVYVINQGTPPAGGVGTGRNTSSGISVFAVGGDGSLTYEDGYSSQGFDPVWAQFDGTGTYLYVLDKYSPDSITTNAGCLKTQTCNGSITVFSADAGTGRLTLVQNTQTIPANGIPLPYFEVSLTPVMMHTAGSCLLTLNSNNTISPFAISSSTGQLSFTGTGTQTPVTNAVQLNSIGGNGTNIYLTDADNGGDTPFLYPFNLATNCNLTPSTGGGRQINASTDFPGTTNPAYSFIDNSGKYVYVLNQSTTTTAQGTPFSSITGWSIVQGTNGQLTPLAQGQYTTGSGPVCMVEDTSNQYMYVSNHLDGTVTGKVIDPTTGFLSDLTRGATFAATGQATCLALSGAVE
ncbi:beta-propeller fold lactonase family protein [Granulicella sp. S156]|uniref:lactonase family protein n=1 Tax=Granulicella sp. S156 TaxID=1747224 RepID=UPI00131D61C6|nr:beta-propeller fold lactonase family protein [Granulicella sp. S156]